MLDSCILLITMYLLSLSTNLAYDDTVILDNNTKVKPSTGIRSYEPY